MSLRTRLVPIVVVSCFCSAAAGQNALGDGTGLDNNRAVGGSGKNRPVRDFEAEFRLRNLMVSGNVGGGANFRGDVGYRAPGEFSGRLGSNDTFSFRRDSLFSALAPQGVTTADALGRQSRLLAGFGDGGGPNAARGLSLNRGGSFVPPDGGRELARRPIPSATDDLPIMDPADPGADARGQDLWMLRSPTGYVPVRGADATVLDFEQIVDQNNQARTNQLVGSPLLGLRQESLTPESEMSESREPQPFIPAGPQEASEEGGPAAPFTREPGVTMSDASPTTDMSGDGLESMYPSVDPRAPVDGASYDALISRLRSSLPETAGSEWNRRLEGIRQTLRVRAGPIEITDDEEEAEEGESEDGSSEVDEGTIKLLRSIGGKIDSLTPARSQSLVFDEHMNKGQTFLSTGRYFDAEARFARALSMKPDHALARAGQVHAQIGAGMFLSAARSLRVMYFQHPELMTSRFDSKILPRRERITSLKEELRKNIDEDAMMAAESAVTLAYLGYQTGDAEAIDAGLDALLRGAIESPPEELVRLARLMDDVWRAQPE